MVVRDITERQLLLQSVQKRVTEVRCLNQINQLCNHNHISMAELLNKALETGNFEGVDYWTKKLSLHLSSHVLHTIFWTNSTNKKMLPTGELLKRIEKNFGTFDKMKAQLSHHSKSVDGNGWGLLGYHPQSDRQLERNRQGRIRNGKLHEWRTEGCAPLLPHPIRE